MGKKSVKIRNSKVNVTQSAFLCVFYFLKLVILRCRQKAAEEDLRFGETIQKST